MVHLDNRQINSRSPVVLVVVFKRRDDLVLLDLDASVKRLYRLDGLGGREGIKSAMSTIVSMACLQRPDPTRSGSLTG